MSDQSELTCVSCETAFEPTATGGFCPDCDTPHPEFEHGEAEAEEDGETGDEATDDGVAGGDETASADAEAPSYCRDCGAEIAGDDAPTAAATTECADCGRTVAADASYCPGCGTELETDEAGESAAEPADGADEAAGDADESAVEATESTGDADADEGTPVSEAETAVTGAATPEPNGQTPEPGSEESDAVPDEVTLVVNGEGYTFEDGDTFGREDEGWLEDLVVAGGGSDELSYISSEHVEIDIEDDGVYVTDVSRNGTLLNSTEMDGGTERVEDGDFLTLAGRAEVEVRL